MTRTTLILAIALGACMGDADGGAATFERYQVTTDLLDAAHGQTETRAMCDPGDRVLSGGCGFNGYAYGYADGPVLEDAEGWACAVRFVAAEAGTVQATAVCEGGR
jgi:hypothetical protein